jgi:DNA-binding transcriptional LysR family regulator
MDTLAGLRMFLAIADEGGLTAAGAKLGLSRALVSKHLLALESRLGVRLFHRTTRRLSLTEAGHAFRERCAHAVADIDEAMRCASDSASAPRGTLRLTAGHAFGSRYITPALADYLTQHPEVRVDLSLNDRLVDIVDEGIDLAIRIGRLEESTLVARRLFTTQLVVCGSPGYFDAHGTPDRPDGLGRHQCLVYAYANEPAIWTFRRGKEVVRARVSGRVDANDGEALMHLAMAGHGIALLPTFMAGDALRAGQLLPVLLDWQTEQLGIYAVYPSRQHLSAKVRTFVDFLADRFEGLPSWENWRELRLPTGAGPVVR